MIAAWILYALLVGVLLGGGAVVVETLLRAHRLPTRWVWAGAMLLSLLWPLGHFLWETLPRSVAQAVPIPDPAGIIPLEPLTVQVGSESFLRVLDAPIVGAWVLATGILLVLFALLLVRTNRLRKGWDGASAVGQPVLMSQDWGPAVVGFLQPSIVLPTWCQELEEQTLRLIVDHELEHVRAGDLRLILSMGVLPILAPWNLFLWWQFSRLRAAVEGDCDLRVLRKHPEDTRPYLELLLDVGKRDSRVRALAATLSESEETLERRIRIMTWPFPKKPWTRGVLLAGMGAFLVALACWAPGPEDEQARESALPEVQVPAPEGSPVALGDAQVVEEEGAASGEASIVISPVANPDELRAALEREYPPLLRDAGIEGTVKVFFHLDGEGRVTRTMVNESSGHKALDDAALRVAEIVEFNPALREGEPVPTWISLPIRFAVGRAARAETRSPAPPIELPPPPGVDAPPLGRKTREEMERNPTFTPYTVKPNIQNRAEVARALKAEYPQDLKEAGIGGTVQVWFFVNEEGVVARVQVNETSGHEALDEAALRVGATIRFTPALNREKAVPVWISLPITFSTDQGASAPSRSTEPPPEAEVSPPWWERTQLYPVEASDLPPPPAQELSSAPTFTPHTVAPDIRNRADVARSLQREYPPQLKEAGIGGTAHVWFFINEGGQVLRAQINETSGHPALDQAALRVAEIIEFTPALNRDETVPVWISLPITFTTRNETPDRTREDPAPEMVEMFPPPPVDLEISSSPPFTPFTVAPDIRNRAEVASVLEREYPPLLRDAEIGGTAGVWFHIDENGQVQRVQINESSGREALDDVALRVASVIEFTPALNRDKAVPVWISVPITFTTR